MADLPPTPPHATDAGDAADAPSEALPAVFDGPLSAEDTMNLAVAAWLHAKFQRSRSVKTQSTYSAIVQAFRSQLQARGLDLDAADPRRVAADVGTALNTSQHADVIAERTRALALAAQAYAAQPATTRYGARPVAATTANLRLAAISSFYRYALRHDFLRGDNPIEGTSRPGRPSRSAPRASGPPRRPIARARATSMQPQKQ